MPGIALGRRRWNHTAIRGLRPGHPLAQNLLCWYNSAETQGRVGGTGIEWNYTPYGRSIGSTNTTSAYANTFTRQLGTLENYTFFSVQRWTSAADYAGAPGLPYAPQSSTWGIPFWALVTVKEAALQDAHFATNVSGTRTTTTISANAFWQVDSKWHSYATSWGNKGGITYLDGVEDGTTATTPATSWTPTFSGTPELVWHGRSASTTGEGAVGTTAFLGLWKRRLDAKEVAMLHDDPFQMFLI
jgi:hypothetical protein